MRSTLSFFWTLGVVLGFTLPAAAQARLTLRDPGLPLQEIQPNDRRVYVLTLEGTWKQPALTGVPYYVNVLFPGGGGYATKIDDETALAKGVVHCLIQPHRLPHHCLQTGHVLVVVSVRHPVCSTVDQDVVSEVVAVKWPLDRPVQKLLPQGRQGPPEPVDRFPPPGDTLPPPKAEKVPPPPPPPPKPEPEAPKNGGKEVPKDGR
jgi:hypothetical protein